MHALRQLVSAAANINRPASQHEPADDASTVASIVAMVFGVIVVTVVLGVIFGPMVSPWWYAKPTRGYVQVMQGSAGSDCRPAMTRGRRCRSRCQPPRRTRRQDLRTAGTRHSTPLRRTRPCMVCSGAPAARCDVKRSVRHAESDRARVDPRRGLQRRARSRSIFAGCYSTTVPSSMYRMAAYTGRRRGAIRRASHPRRARATCGQCLSSMTL